MTCWSEYLAWRSCGFAWLRTEGEASSNLVIEFLVSETQDVILSGVCSRRWRSDSILPSSKISSKTQGFETDECCKQQETKEHIYKVQSVFAVT